MDYAALVNTIKAYTENDFPDTVGTSDLTSDEQLATFVRQAEQRIYNTVQLLADRSTDTLTTTTNDPYLAVPTDWLSNFSMAVIDPTTEAYSYLLNKDVNFMRESFPDPTDTGAPQYYAYYDNTQYILAPTPDDTYDVEVIYYKYPESIVTATNTWLGDNFDSVLLYGALLEAYTYMKGEPDVIAEYQKRYDDALSQLKQLAEGKNRQDTYRTIQARLPVR
jgi:hypothetical protein